MAADDETLTSRMKQIYKSLPTQKVLAMHIGDTKFGEREKHADTRNEGNASDTFWMLVNQMLSNSIICAELH